MKASVQKTSEFIKYPGDNDTGSTVSEQLVSLSLIMADKEQGVKGGKAATDSVSDFILQKRRTGRRGEAVCWGC